MSRTCLSRLKEVRGRLQDRKDSETNNTANVAYLQAIRLLNEHIEELEDD